MPLPPAGRMHRRITRDRDTLELIEDLSVRATGLDRRADKAFKKPRNILVEVFIDQVEEEALSASERSLYRAVVARINYLAQDSGDLQYASKQCSRKSHCTQVVTHGMETSPFRPSSLQMVLSNLLFCCSRSVWRCLSALLS